jgi:BolA protein
VNNVAEITAAHQTQEYGALMTMKDRIAADLMRGLKPTRLEITDESHLHAGHAGARAGGESHFRIDVVSEGFAGKGRVERHRMIYSLLAQEIADGVHALALNAKAPGES